MWCVLTLALGFLVGFVRICTCMYLNRRDLHRGRAWMTAFYILCNTHRVGLGARDLIKFPASHRMSCAMSIKVEYLVHGGRRRKGKGPGVDNGC